MGCLLQVGMSVPRSSAMRLGYGGVGKASNTPGRSGSLIEHAKSTEGWGRELDHEIHGRYERGGGPGVGGFSRRLLIRGRMGLGGVGEAANTWEEEDLTQRRKDAKVFSEEGSDDDGPGEDRDTLCSTLDFNLELPLLHFGSEPDWVWVLAVDVARSCAGLGIDNDVVGGRCFRFRNPRIE